MFYTQQQLFDKLRTLKPEMESKFSISRIGVFGSYARNEQREDSDIDVLVEFSKPVGFEFFRLESYLQQQLGRKIDLATQAMLKTRIRPAILNETIYA